MSLYQQTSAEAWESFVPISAELDRAIMRVLSASGPAGTTCQAVEDLLKRSHQSVSGNLRHLVERGLVVATGTTGRTHSGRAAMRWRLADADCMGVAPVTVVARCPHCGGEL